MQASSLWASLPNVFLFLGDVAALTASFYFARISHALYYNLKVATILLHWWGSAFSANLLLFPMMIFITLAWFVHNRHYNRGKSFWDELGEIFEALTFLALLNAAFAFSGRLPLSRIWLFSTWILAFILVPLLRFIIHYMIIKSRLWQRPYVLLGSGDNALEASRAIKSEPILGYHLSALLLPEETTVNCEFESTLPRIPVGHDPLATLKELGNPHLVVALENKQYASMNDLLELLGLSYPNLTIAPTLRGLPLLGLTTLHFFNHEIVMLRSRDNLSRFVPRFMKRSFDMVCASVLVAILSPFLLLITWLIIRQDKGPAMFSHERVGKAGKEFGCLKFRTMVIDADKRLIDYFMLHPGSKEDYERTFKLKDDPRVTPIGRFLRRTSLDELPQLFNVLKGEMSLVGPRPVTLHEIEKYYGKVADSYKRVLPGITGLWQTSGRSDTTYEQRLYFDSWYVKNWSLWYDIVILLRTVKVVFGKKGAY
ncbi:UDP-phosphate galactose phosphotransferase [Acidithiobacillus thiooxidans]|uniref:UDP-phosphate galactose phosphotransferase n=1 Tax=Acidithiobacillus thiooxidans TaxID=930 RepID=A0A1C2I3Q2_ACITH|nr:UDP-phosphate galactose phosphotransferase [Acidithiobacillus thiooxidans]OCX70642.1 UDP-phosphate galactose phosphotransferase [Acidithiobacillus thiooxidans]OCX77298.1 UDP-phosphate galactose phosphotransferase [Acidithiobacillus thiooxidans]OCX88340.1 UDP-phosphate galactose phosphotransferase [Acidithiobacillus thiooxidans]OFC47140.1 UDP-phosphate galactose phosphotransferase [Acidithiobacillus thiooxidans]